MSSDQVQTITPSLKSDTAESDSVAVQVVEKGSKAPQLPAPKPKNARFWLVFLAICLSMFLSALEFVSKPCI